MLGSRRVSQNSHDIRQRPFTVNVSYDVVEPKPRDPSSGPGFAVHEVILRSDDGPQTKTIRVQPGEDLLHGFAFTEYLRMYYSISQESSPFTNSTTLTLVSNILALLLTPTSWQSSTSFSRSNKSNTF